MAIHLMAAIAESLRFLAVVFLAFAVGGLLSPSVSGVLRYAAASQLLFAAGFFFLWLDPVRYSSYKPLLTIGKLASIACLLPLALAMVRDPKAAALAFGIPGLGAILAFFIALVDFASLSTLLLVRPRLADGREPPGGARPGQGPSGPVIPGQGPSGPIPGQGPSGPVIPGQGPEDIERVEGI